MQSTGIPQTDRSDFLWWYLTNFKYAWIRWLWYDEIKLFRIFILLTIFINMTSDTWCPIIFPRFSMVWKSNMAARRKTKSWLLYLRNRMYKICQSLLKLCILLPHHVVMGKHSNCKKNSKLFFRFNRHKNVPQRGENSILVRKMLVPVGRSVC